MDIGMRIIIEDYVGQSHEKAGLAVFECCVQLVGCLLCAFAILMMMFESALMWLASSKRRWKLSRATLR